MRLFIAINFTDKIKETVADIRDGLKEESLVGNFSFDENLHLTLIFLGECNYHQMNVIKTVMDNAVFTDFKLVLEKIGYFKRDGGNTWWIGIKESASLSDLQADLCSGLRQKGFVLENRKFTPHITIGREVKMRIGYILPEIQHVDFKVTNIELMKSERINGKQTYTSVYSKEAISHTSIHPPSTVMLSPSYK